MKDKRCIFMNCLKSRRGHETRASSNDRAEEGFSPSLSLDGGSQISCGHVLGTHCRVEPPTTGGLSCSRFRNGNGLGLGQHYLSQAAFLTSSRSSSPMAVVPPDQRTLGLAQHRSAS